MLTMQQYRDRVEAGQVLARSLAHYASRVDALVLGTTCGGIAVGAEVASYLNAPLDAFLVRKLALPDNPDVPVGAIASGGIRVLDELAMNDARLSRADFSALAEREAAELHRSELLYRGHRTSPRIAGRVVIMVTDGLTTGFTMHAAVIALHQHQPAWIVVAAPVGSPEACEELAQEAHEVVCPLRPEPFRSVGLWYDHFPPLHDDEVRAHLSRARQLPAA